MARFDRLTCEDMFRRLDDFLDHELGAEETERVQAHLDVCARCAEEYRFDRTMLERTREKLARIQAPGSLLDSIRRRIEGASGDDV
jgi:mycothiol system anti-sigma-R factor